MLDSSDCGFAMMGGASMLTFSKKAALITGVCKACGNVPAGLVRNWSYGAGPEVGPRLD